MSFVALSHRPLIARWLKWALMVHKLREELAKYTAVGVAGLVNSGKSILVNTVFGIKVYTSIIYITVSKANLICNTFKVVTFNAAVKISYYTRAGESKIGSHVISNSSL